MAATHGKPSEAPLAEDDMPEQDGSEDPGVGLELNRDAELALGKGRASSPTPSPSGAEHVDTRGGLNVSEGRRSADKPRTEGVGEGATVSHIDTQSGRQQ